LNFLKFEQPGKVKATGRTKASSFDVKLREFNFIEK
jgi:hypothetical protein